MRTVGELKRFMKGMPDSMYVRAYEGEVGGIVFEMEYPQYYTIEIAFFDTRHDGEEDKNYDKPPKFAKNI